MHRVVTRHYFRRRYWVATLLLAASVAASAAIGVRSQWLESQRSHYSFALHRLGDAAMQLTLELDRLALGGAVASSERQGLRRAFIELLTTYRALSLSDPEVQVFRASEFSDRAQIDHLAELGAEFGISDEDALARLDLVVGGMPEIVADFWEPTDGRENVRGDIALEVATHRMLDLAAPLARASGPLSPGEIEDIRRIDVLQHDAINPAIESLTSFMRSDMARAKFHLTLFLIGLSSAAVGIAFANVFLFFRPLEQAVMGAQAELAVERDRALEAAVAKRDFLSMMSHELRTPMNGVLGFAGLLLASELKPEQRRQVEIIRSSGRTLLALVNDILDLARMEAGSLELAEEPFSLEEVIGEVLALGSAGAAQKGLETAVFIDPRLPAVLRGDRERVRQILTNLVGNAIKFTEQGAVTVEVTRLEGGRTGGVTFELAVSDTGPGIPAEQQARVFDRFAQAEQAARHRSEGSGLGLAICRELVERMGGEIRLESVPGKGSTFRVRLEMEADENVVEAEAPCADCDRTGAGAPWTQASEAPAQAGTLPTISAG